MRHMIATAGAPVVIEPHDAKSAGADVVREGIAFVREALGVT
jgi:hypothetical protein